MGSSTARFSNTNIKEEVDRQIFRSHNEWITVALAFSMVIEVMQSEFLFHFTLLQFNGGFKLYHP